MVGLTHSFSRHPLLTTRMESLTQSWEQETASRRPPTTHLPLPPKLDLRSRVSISGIVTRTMCTHTNRHSRFCIFFCLFFLKKPGQLQGDCSKMLHSGTLFPVQGNTFQRENRWATITFPHSICEKMGMLNKTSTYVSPLMYLRLQFKHFMRKGKGLSFIGWLSRKARAKKIHSFPKCFFHKGQYFNKMSADVLPPPQRCGRMMHPFYLWHLWFWREDFLFFRVDQVRAWLSLAVPSVKFMFALILMVHRPLCQLHVYFPCSAQLGWLQLKRLFLFPESLLTA